MDNRQQSLEKLLSIDSEKGAPQEWLQQYTEGRVSLWSIAIPTENNTWLEKNLGPYSMLRLIISRHALECFRTYYRHQPVSVLGQTEHPTETGKTERLGIGKDLSLPLLLNSSN